MKREGQQRTIFTVSEVSRRIKSLIEGEFADVWIEGEVSNLRRSAAGHLYFTLKDDRSQLPAVCFKSSALYLRFKPKNGESFRARGRLSIYAGRGEYQILVDVLEPAGRGALQESFERLKEKLEAEGLFASERKKPLPPFPSRIGVVTSPGSAALRDVLAVLDRRHDAIDVLIYPSDVQGDRAAGQIAAGIEALAKTDVDIVVLTRGGGSIEDLWPFNEEVVARAITACAKPVVSAVGHETDFTICDFVADVRAATPSAAAEIVASTKRELVDRLDVARKRMHAGIRYRLSELRQFLAARVGGRGFAIAEGRLKQLSQQVDDCVFRMDRVARSGELIESRRRRLDYAWRSSDRWMKAMVDANRRRLFDADAASGRLVESRLFMAKQRFLTLAETLDALSPLGVLDRGFAVCRTPDGTVVRSAEQVPVDTEVDVLLRKGELRARVTRAKIEGRRSGGETARETGRREQ
jgi:exodeoxyribonuclease VII large subunit